MLRKFIILTLFLSIFIGSTVVAQSGLQPKEGRWTHLEYNQEGDCWGAVSLTLDDVLDDPNFQPNFTLFYDEFSDTYLAAFDGPDYLYIPNGDGEFRVAMLQTLDGFTFFGNATVIEGGEEILFTGTMFIDQNCILNFTHVLGWVDQEPASVWVETERSFSDISLFNDCLGRDNATPSDAWAQRDLAIPIELQDAGGGGFLLVGSRAFTEEGGAYVFEQSASSSFVSTYMQISLLPVSDVQLSVNAFYQMNDRTDCSVVYSSTYFKSDNIMQTYEDEEIIVPNIESLQEIEDTFNALGDE